MKASIVELRTKMNDITKALSRRENVTILSHGKPIGLLHAFSNKSKKPKKKSVENHPYFGSIPAEISVDEIMESLRGNRFNVI